MYLQLILTAFCVSLSKSQLTFKNVMVTCETYGTTDDDEISFGTIVTAARLKPHLPNVDTCYKISIDHSKIPILYPNSLSNIKTNILLLENDNIEDIRPGALRNVVVADGISLKHNRLTQLQNGVFNDVKVPVLYLSHNWISYIDHQAFDNMTALKSLHLDHNQLNRIDDSWFQNTPNLQKLTFHHNSIREVSGFVFRNLENGAQIDLSQNQIWRVNRNAFQKPKKFNLISLANNQLQDLEPDWLKGVGVGTLDVSGNRLVCLRGGLAPPPSTNLIDGNPWNCDCLWQIKNEELRGFGGIVAPEAFRRCSNL